MQEHWAEWGPPVYLVASSYFKLNKRGKRKKKTITSDGLPVGVKPQERRSAAQFFGDLVRDFTAAGGSS